MFCGEDCMWDKNDVGHCKGEAVGEKIICTGCLEQLKALLKE
jgi:hypothetical protein